MPAPLPADAALETLDPFGLWPDATSRIAGLGSTAPAPDPATVFHTAYRPLPSGAVAFDIRFSGLAATTGSLVLVVRQMAEDGAPLVAKFVHVSLAALAAADGRYRLTLDIEAGRHYALQGQIFDASDATAEGLAITCGPRDDGSLYATRLERARAGLLRHRGRGRRAALTVRGPASLATPVSQMCTAAQMDDPLYAEWLRRMGEHAHRHRKQWEFVYIAQALYHHGMLQAGRRGVGFGVGVEPLPAMFAAMGVSSVATDLAADDERALAWSLTHQHGKALEDLRRPAICPDEQFEPNVRFEPVDMTAIPGHLRDFDFCWSSCALEHLGTIRAGLAFIEASLETLRPGGLAVHTTELNLTSNLFTVRRGSTVLFRRRDLERLALALTARGHQVMPFNWDAGTHQDDRFVDVPPYSTDIHLKVEMRRYVTTSFGIIIRKAG